LRHQHVSLNQEGISLVIDTTAWSVDLRLTADGEGIVAWAGAVPVRMLADRTGLTGALSAVLARRGFDPLHDRGRVLTDVAVDIEALRAQAEVFGSVASTPPRAAPWTRPAGGPVPRSAGSAPPPVCMCGHCCPTGCRKPCSPAGYARRVCGGVAYRRLAGGGALEEGTGRARACHVSV